MESTIGLYKTELIKKHGPWKTLANVELATADYVDWFNTRRLRTANGGIPPAEYKPPTTLKPSPIQRLDPKTIVDRALSESGVPSGRVPSWSETRSGT
jgi:Integrase core domain